MHVSERTRREGDDMMMVGKDVLVWLREEWEGSVAVRGGVRQHRDR